MLTTLDVNLAAQAHQGAPLRPDVPRPGAVLVRGSILFLHRSCHGLHFQQFGRLHGRHRTSIVCYAAAIIFAFYPASLALSAFDKYPELKPYLRHLLGGSADAWDSTFGALTFVGTAPIVHFTAFLVFSVSGISSVLPKVFVYFFGFMGLILGVSSLGSFGFKPFLRSCPTGGCCRAAPRKSPSAR